MQDLFSVNVFGPIRITQCILPYFRTQGHGQIAFIGAGVAWGPIPFLTHYAAAKAALNSFVEGLRKELHKQPVHCTILEPGGFASQLGQARSGSDEGFGKYQPQIEPYVELFGEIMGVFVNEIMPNVPGDIERFAKTIVDLLGDQEKAKKLPVRLVLGSDAAAVVKQKCEEQLSLLNEFRDVSTSTDRDDAHTLSYDGTLKLASMKY
jgi:NAD(P)-dependent dehydrogenase (short-subunit alcohol dehydrogenase family)